MGKNLTRRGKIGGVSFGMKGASAPCQARGRHAPLDQHLAPLAWHEGLELGGYVPGKGQAHFPLPTPPAPCLARKVTTSPNIPIQPDGGG